MDVLRGLAANFLGLSFGVRAFLFALCATLALALFFRFGLRPLLLALLCVLRGILRALFILVGRGLLELLRRLVPAAEAAYNGYAEFMEKGDALLGAASDRLRGGRRGGHALRTTLLLTLALVGLTVGIQLPRLLKGVVHAAYLDAFRMGETAYLAVERGIRAFAADSPPLLEPVRSPTGAPTLPAAAPPTPSPTPRKGFVVRTSGGQNANVRVGPNSRSKVVAKVESGAAVLDAEEREGNWVKIETEDGEVGWVHNSLLDQE